ncbi:uncharacterized protein A4U43_C02F12650 [Asparagus officinalis]|uniref:Uncharacterized protein n=1 Tax=Asparagus officinalis TaxID=4686 RepID=A0A5P1FIM6_ASPOF|nr:uncharacterized protein A4U43_C02F12650 [Asparagus officinalis]
MPQKHIRSNLALEEPEKIKADASSPSPTSRSFHYPSRVANYVYGLKEIERKGGQLMLECKNGDENGDKLVQGTGEGTGRDS